MKISVLDARVGPRLLLGGCLALLGAGALAATDFTQRLYENLGAATTADDAADDAAPLSSGWSGRLDELRVEDLPIPDSAREKSALGEHANIDATLQALLLETRDKGVFGLDEVARRLGVPYVDQRVLVRLVADDRRGRDRLEREVRDLGGEVTARFEEVVLARVPARALAELPGLRGMAYAAPQAMFAPAYDDVLNLEYLDARRSHADDAAPKTAGAVVSEGVGITGADQLHREGITGKGVKIGIIDFGYQRYDELQRQGEVPEPAAARAFNQSGEMASNTVHGTACAEIIHDMAPDATLYLAAIDGADDQIIQAASWLAEQGVEIISFSGGGHFGPHNGQALLDRLIDQMTESSGIAWIVAAGNDGAQHWLGRTEDANGDGLVDVDNPAAPVDVLLIAAPQATEAMLLVYWDDWGADATVPRASQDIDAHLFALTDPNPILVASSTLPQNGRGAPIEGFRETLPAGVYALALEGKRLKSPVNLHVVAQGVEIRPIEPTGSIAIPATAAEALAVGAVDVRNGEGEPFSSRGPTDDGRQKPQVVAPDHNLSSAYAASYGRFPGTSAACPHVSGFAALLKQRRPGLSQPDLFQELLAQVEPMGQPVPNPRYGFGHISAARLQQAASAPGNGEAGSDAVDFLRERLQIGQ